MGIPLTERDAARFWAKVERRDPTECWPWIGCIHRIGYGGFKIGGKTGYAASAHRIAAALSFADFDESAHYLHSCDNRACCNPSHLHAGSHVENMREMVTRGRNKTPRPGNGHKKITEANRADIHRLFSEGKNKSEIARIFAVTPTRIRQILREAA